jgi:hypothetical protein
LYRVKWTRLAQPYEHEYAAQVFNNKILENGIASAATTAEQVREHRREQVRTAIKKFHSNPTKSAVEKARENFRQRQERENNSDSDIRRRQMDVNRKKERPSKRQQRSWYVKGNLKRPGAR